MPSPFPGMDPYIEHPEPLSSRRRFLEQTSLGAAGLALTGGAWRVLAAEGSSANQITIPGGNLDSREIGIKALLYPEYGEVRWRRWSEWGIFPEESISRTEGRAKARRDRKWPAQPANVKPDWPWSQDQTELGTADFRSIKFHIYEASLVAPDGSGVRAEANAGVHFRACLAKEGVRMHILSQCPLAPVVLKSAARLTGEFSVQLMTKHGQRW